jgi:hypothetical protein
MSQASGLRPTAVPTARAAAGLSIAAARRPYLKRRAFHERAQRGSSRTFATRLEDFPGQPGRRCIVVQQTRLWPALFQHCQCRRAVSSVDEGEMTQTAGTLADQAAAEGAVGKAGGNRPARAAGFHFTGRGRLQDDAEIVQSARTRQPGLQGGSQDTPALAKQRLRMGQREALQKILGRDPRPGGEQAVKVEWAQAGNFRKAREIGLLGVARIQMANDSCDALVLVHGRIVPRRDRRSHPILAALPGPYDRAVRTGTSSLEPDQKINVLSPRQAQVVSGRVGPAPRREITGFPAKGFPAGAVPTGRDLAQEILNFERSSSQNR